MLCVGLCDNRKCNITIMQLIITIIPFIRAGKLHLVLYLANVVNIRSQWILEFEAKSIPQVKPCINVQLLYK